MSATDGTSYGLTVRCVRSLCRAHAHFITMTESGTFKKAERAGWQSVAPGVWRCPKHKLKVKR